jgi:hypothetical protein
VVSVSAAEIITSVATLVTAIGGVILLLRKVKSLEEKQDQVHVLVNSNHKSMLRREQVLITALQRAGIDIPPDDSLEDEE